MVQYRRLPLMHEAAEHLVMGHLLRRNIFAYKAPPNNEGYDLVCIHPNPRRRSPIVRIQVKSRYQTDGDRSVFVRKETFRAFDFLVIALLNVGWYYSDARRPSKGRAVPEFITLPRSVARRLYYQVKSGMNRVLTDGRDLSAYSNERGFELVARALKIRYPSP
jgi:hypothetical protein